VELFFAAPESFLFRLEIKHVCGTFALDIAM